MPKYFVLVESVYEEAYKVEAKDEKEAAKKVLAGEGIFRDTWDWQRFGDVKDVEELRMSRRANG